MICVAVRSDAETTLTSNLHVQIHGVQRDRLIQANVHTMHYSKLLEDPDAPGCYIRAHAGSPLARVCPRVLTR